MKKMPSQPKASTWQKIEIDGRMPPCDVCGRKMHKGEDMWSLGDVIAPWYCTGCKIKKDEQQGVEMKSIRKWLIKHKGKTIIGLPEMSRKENQKFKVNQIFIFNDERLDYAQCTELDTGIDWNIYDPERFAFLLEESTK